LTVITTKSNSIDFVVVIPMMPSLSKDGWGTNDAQPRWSGLNIV
jgi:hypothetical protein